ncbi:MAG: HAMP domain-containing histidine kinase [Planctomycetes bacterium]|nr:HAMP domain-containing histidine kinase [Planctomycetota bacterium]
MSVLRLSLRSKLVLPAILTTSVAVLAFARYTVARVGLTMEEQHRQKLVGAAEMLARDSGIYLATIAGRKERAEEALASMMGLVPSLLRVELWRNGEGGALDQLLVAGPVGPSNLDAWGELTTDGVKPMQAKDIQGYSVAVAIYDDPISSEREAVGVEGVDGSGGDGTTHVREQRRIGTLLLWASRAPIVRALNEYVWAIAPVALFFLGLAMGLGLLLTAGVLRHLRGLTEAAVSLGQGTRDVKIPVHGDDEISALAMSFNVMSEKLEFSRRRIEEQNRTLEQKVTARTRELLRAYEELQTLDRAKDSFLSSVSHELRTPLTSIRSFSEILLDYGDEEDPELRREFLTIIKAESERLSRLINQVLDLAKIEAGCMTWELANFDFRELVEAAVKALSGLEHNKPVGFRLELPDDKISYFGDRDRLHQVLTNLLTNAWKFSPDGTDVTVRVARLEGGIEVRIADRGPGVPDDGEKERIFDRFRQGVHNLTDKPEGTGLGLPISKEIVNMHGGFIACEDNPGGGALFRFLLPEVEPDSPRPIDRAVAGESDWEDLSHERNSVFESSWVWAARTAGRAPTGR